MVCHRDGMGLQRPSCPHPVGIFGNAGGVGVKISYLQLRLNIYFVIFNYDLNLKI